MDIHDARKEKIDEPMAWDIIKDCNTVIIAKGKSMVKWTPSDDSRGEILRHAMGRSGSLRAPSVMIGRTFIIGFNDAMYERYVTS